MKQKKRRVRSGRVLQHVRPLQPATWQHRTTLWHQISRVTPQHSFNDSNVNVCCAYWHSPAVPSAAAGPAWAPAATLSAPAPAHTWRQTVARESGPSRRTSTCFPGHCLGRTPSQSSLCSPCRWKSHPAPRHPATSVAKWEKKTHHVLARQRLKREEALWRFDSYQLAFVVEQFPALGVQGEPSFLKCLILLWKEKQETQNNDFV